MKTKHSLVVGIFCESEWVKCRNVSLFKRVLIIQSTISSLNQVVSDYTSVFTPFPMTPRTVSSPSSS